MSKYLRLHGEIGEGDSASGVFIEVLESVPPSQPVFISVNSPGGSYFDGLAIHNAIKRRGNVTVIVEALAASAASLIAMGAKKIVMSSAAMLMVHSPLATARGNPTEIESTLNTLRKIERDMAGIYSQRAYAMSVEEALVLMRAETWLDGETTRNVFRGVEVDAGKIAASISPEWLKGYRNVPLSLTLEQHVNKTTPAKVVDAAELRAGRERRARKRKRMLLIALAGKMDPVAARENREQRRRDLKRGSLVHTLERVRANIAMDAERDLAEREAAKAAKAAKADAYCRNWNNIPRGTR